MRSRIPAAVILIIGLIIGSAVSSYAGGPAFVAGSGYDPGVEGQSMIWANGSVQYFTDQGDLSATLTGAQADTFVATAFNTWTAIPGVGLTASQRGHLAEDVNGSDIVVAANGMIAAPTDITSSAITTPVGIVYDYDGTVTDALLGVGAGGLSDCFTNAVYGSADNFSAAGNIAHALIVINGVCASTAAQLPDVQYRLVRVLGNVLGLGWSQANVNVLTRNPTPTSADVAGFPVMHYDDPISCIPISACYTDAAVPKMDDIDALARLYPANANSQDSGRIYGSVYFTDASGNALQPMQGVNVVARLMASGQPSRQYVATSVSGFLFHGNAGNIIDGYLDGDGLRYDRWGSSDVSLEGFFDLGQLPIPSGQSIAQYELSVEGLDPDWSLGVEPYAPNQVNPSGSFAPVVVTVAGGSNAERDILMLQNEIAQAHPGSGSTYTNPAALPQGGAWGSWISGYGSADFFEFTAQANRTASVVVTAIDEAGQPTEDKLLPVIGIWQLSDQTGNPAPASTPSAFNSTTFAMTRLDVQFGTTDTFKVGVADFRGDGRPDYFYQASLLYSDSVTPSRVSLDGGVATLRGIGFSPALQVTADGTNANILSASASQIQMRIPAALQDGTATVQVTDPVTGAFSQMIGALTYGALPTDQLLLLQGAEPRTPVGAAAANPIRVRVVASDGVTPVVGATVAWSATNGLQFSACGGATFCSVLSDQAGESSSLVTPTASGVSTITIALAPQSYPSPQTQLATVVATSSTLDLVAMTPTRWIAQGATIAVPLTVEALNLGVPMANVAINFTISRGTTTLSATTATTNASGFAAITAQLTNQDADVQVSACAAPNNTPCQTFTMFSTPASMWTLQTVSGSAQVVPQGQQFSPLVMRVTDGTSTANPVMGVNVTFETTLARASSDEASSGNSDGVPIILGSSQAQVVTTQDGLASIVPSIGNVGPCEVFVTVNAGQLTAQFQMESVAAIVAGPLSNLGVLAERPIVRHEPQFSSQTETADAPSLFSAFPQGIAETSAESNPGSCSELSALGVSSSNGDLILNSASAGDSSTAPCAQSKPDELKVRKATESPQNDVVAVDAISTNQPTSVNTNTAPSVSDWLLEDKRSCRTLADDGHLL